MQLKWQMDIDEMVYIGDTDYGKYGLVNSAQVSSGAVAVNAAGTSTLWIHKTADEILYDVNTLIEECWSAAGFAVCPSKLLLPPAAYAYIVSQKVSTAGNVSILRFLEDNCVSLGVNGKKLDIQPLKWLTGRGTAIGSPVEAVTDRMVVYTQDKIRVRFPLVPLQRTPLEYRSIYHLTTYFGRLGVMEFVYPATVAYADGI
jgi:hypothetical protein